jgi:hypothetical protein
MSSTYSYSLSETFTILHARLLASKVATDLKRIQRFYLLPSDLEIQNYEVELTQLLKYDVVDSVVYGFKRAGKWTEVAVRYKALPGGTLAVDDDPGKIRPGLNTTSALFTSFLSYTNKWWGLSSGEKRAIKDTLPIQRSSGDVPSLEGGYWSDDLTYSAGGRGLGRSSVRW